MKKFVALSFILFSLFIVSTSAQFGRGCLLEKRDTSLIQKRNFPKSILPASYSLKKYAPPVLSQGNLSSCTAWSSAYCAYTICKRIETGNINSQPFSPLNLYNRLKAKTSEDPCYAGGAYVSEALTMLQDQGCARFNDVANNCGYASASEYYYDQLYGFDEINVKTSDIKSALTKNCPVVMVIQYYKNGWGESANLPNAVWNGVYSEPDGYHAMCIIGYDDNVGSEGAFLVQNSWGSDWGKDGCFWLQYKDLFHLNQAFMVIPNPSGSNDNTNSNDANNFTHDGDTTYQDMSTTDQVLRIYNECSVTAYVALGQYENGSWVTRGWYAAQSQDYIDLPIGTREADDIYWLAINNTNDLMWYDSENGTDMCYDPTDAFTIYDNANPNCPKYVKFFKETPGYDGTIYSQTLTCPSTKSRGNGTIVYSTNVKEEKHDNRPPDQANYEWKKGYELMDLYSKRIIHPSSNGTYTIWYIDTDKSIKTTSLKEDKLEELKAYKFVSEENAKKWLALQK